MGGMLALGACGCRATGWFGSSELVRLGVLSDIHLTTPGSEDTFIKALRYFDSRRVDGVVIAGDLADRGRVSQLKLAADAWRTVFPGDRRSDGAHVEKLFVYGNHDVQGWEWDDLPQADEATKRAEAIGYGDNPARVWEQCFGERYEPVWMKRVRGVQVIGAHWRGQSGTELAKYLAAQAAEIDCDRPLICIQHPHPKGTCIGDWASCCDDGQVTEALGSYPNAVVFSGHSHYTLTDERSVWQGGFTSINTSSLSETSYDYSLRENVWGRSGGFRGDESVRRRLMGGFRTNEARQGMVVSVFADRLEIERREFVTDTSLGPDWIVPLPAGSGAFSFAARAAKRVAPQFAAGARAELRRFTGSVDMGGGRMVDREIVEVSFPAAEPREGCRVFDYEISAVLVEDDLDLVQVQRRIIAPDHHLSPSAPPRPGSCPFALDELPLKGHYRFEVRPIECFGKKGAPLVSDVIFLKV